MTITDEDARAYRKLISTMVGMMVGNAVTSCIDDPDWAVKTRALVDVLVAEVKAIITADTTPHVLAFLEDRVRRLTTDESLLKIRGMVSDLRNVAADCTDPRELLNHAQAVKRRAGL